MPYEQRPNTGQLFKNKDRKNDRAPNVMGSALVLEAADETIHRSLRSSRPGNARWRAKSPGERLGRVQPGTSRQKSRCSLAFMARRR